MGGLLTLAVTYVAGGLTFIPLVLCAVLLHAYFTFPYVPQAPRRDEQDPVQDPGDDGRNVRSGLDAVDEKLQRNYEKEFGGYFAVCREWIPGGINGKPPERTTPAGEVIAEESPSVYQSMYRSIFDRKQAPTMDVGKANGRTAKKARNVFYIVLRHGHLMLYDDTEQVEVRHVISLALHDVDVYAGGEEEVPEGELWIKRNAIRLRRKSLPAAMSSTSKPFYLFSENCSDKEDFYFALLQNQERDGNDPHPPPLVQHFEVKHIISLVQRLHSSEEQLQTRWINALVGRLFLGIYKTQEVEDFIRMKITKKISRVKKPAFLSGIVLQKIDLGEAAPFITNPRLKDLTVEGDCCAEADVRYEGNFRIEIAATAKIDLGTRFKAREVDLVLAITMKKIAGHVLVRFKPPPSNRIWISFETMPQLEMNIEPIVSSRQITYSIFLRAIESRIREVFAETLVLPHWDDSPFLSSLKHHFRGGIWVNERRGFQPPTETVVPDDEPEDLLGAEVDEAAPASALQSPAEDRSSSAPPSTDNVRPGLFSRKSQKASQPTAEGNDTASATGVQKAPEVSRAIRPKSFTLAADPVVSTDHGKSEPGKTDSKTRQTQDAASLMTEISNRSQPGSPHSSSTPAGSHGSRRSSLVEKDPPEYAISTSSRNSRADLNTSQTTLTSGINVPSRGSSVSLGSKSLASGLDASSTSSSTRLQSVAKSLTPSEKKQQTLSAAAVAAKNWSWKTLTKSRTSSGTPAAEKVGTPDHPIGRGRPLPPPGQPLPLPEKRGSGSRAVPKRKPIPPPALPDRPISQTASTTATTGTGTTPPDTNLAGSHHVPEASTRDDAEDDDDGMLVVEAPAEAADSLASEDENYGEFMDNVKPEEEEEDKEEEKEGEKKGTEKPSLTPRVPDTEHFGKDKHGSEKEQQQQQHEEQQEVVEQRRKDKDGEEEEEDEEALSPLPRPGSSSLTASYYDGVNGLSSWQSAQEQEARSPVWMLEQEHP